MINNANVVIDSSSISNQVFSVNDLECCQIDEGVETLLCPKNWEETLLHREFVELAQAFHQMKAPDTQFLERHIRMKTLAQGY